jgi:hypothetical protein
LHPLACWPIAVLPILARPPGPKIWCKFELIFMKVDWALDPIRNEPQFKAIEARMKFPP